LWYIIAKLKNLGLCKDGLNQAQQLYEDKVAPYADGFCGGGFWWDLERTYKNAITNELVMHAASLFYKTNESNSFLALRDSITAWFLAIGMINSENLINDGLSNCQNNDGATWTYN